MNNEYESYVYEVKPLDEKLLQTVDKTAKEVGSLVYNQNISDEEFRREATTLLSKMFASI